MGQNQSTPTDAGRQQQPEQQRENSSSTSSSNEDLLNGQSGRTTTTLGDVGHRTPSSGGSVDSLALPSHGRRSGLSGLSTLRLRRNAAATSAGSNNMNTPVGQGTEDMETTAMPISSRRRRRTSSSDETTSSARYKRRQRTNTLRRLTQFGSNFMNSLTAGQREDGEQEQEQQPSTSAEDDRRGSVDMLNNVPSSLVESPGPGSSAARPHIGGGGGGHPVVVDSSRPHHTTRRSPFSLRSNRGHGQGAGTSLTSNSDGGFESQAAMLSRLLAIAASVTATTLVGSSYRGGVGFGRSSASEDAPASNDTDDSFHGFLDGLNNGLLASELSNSLENPDDPTGPRRAQNFFRMFRFPPSTDSTPGMVPVLIVGIRAVDNNEETATATSGATDDAPPAGTTNMAADTNPENLSFFNASSSRSIRMNRSANNTSTTTANNDNNNNNNSSSIYEAESGEARPRRPRTVYLDDDDSESEDDETMSFHSTQSSSRPTQSLLDRLRSPFSSNNANNRNTADMLFDDIFSDRSLSNLRDRQQEQQETQQSETQDGGTQEQGREHTRQSWIVYVVGGTYPDNHPILLAPSLFTDNPSYEDLLTLENFLGQAKPPVATREDIENSGGIIKVGALETDDEVRPGERCLICLSSYETGEECRQLKTCGHMFHKECIDQWLITGRNSCPLCRGEGVKPLNSETPAEDTPPVP
jgi:hypothetical protein